MSPQYVKKWVRGGRYPEGTSYPIEIKVSKLKQGETLPPPEVPPTLPDGTPLLTQAKLIEKNFDEAGCPTKGSQPQSDFKPDH